MRGGRSYADPLLETAGTDGAQLIHAGVHALPTWLAAARGLWYTEHGYMGHLAPCDDSAIDERRAKYRDV